MKRLTNAVILAAGLAAASSAAHGQQQMASSDQSTGSLADIIVTAERRSSDVQKTALSISAVSADQLTDAGVIDAKNLTAAIPVLSVVEAQGPYPQFGMRGIYARASNAYSDPAIIMSVDGVVLAHPNGTHGIFYDLERVEVLKGPQGTLYGRNATGGVINVISQKPRHELGGFASFELGTYDLFQITGAVNLPVTDTLALRAAGQRVRRDGFFSDGTSDDHVDAVRISALWEPNPDVSLLMRTDRSHVGGKGPGATLISNTNNTAFPYGAWTSAADVPCAFTCAPPAGVGSPHALPRRPFIDNTYIGVSAELNWTTPIGAFTILPAYRAGDVHFLGNTNLFFALQREDWKQRSIEARLASSENNRLRYIAGLYYLKDEVTAQQNYANPNNAAPINPTRSVVSHQLFHQKAETIGFFGQITFSLVDTLRLVGGLRYTKDEKRVNATRFNVPYFDPDVYRDSPYENCNNVVGTVPTCLVGPPFSTIPVPGGSSKLAYNSTNWKIGVEFDAGPASLIYANVATGYRAGGFFYGTTAAGSTYNPERVVAYVIGSKNRFLGNLIQVNIEGFYYKYNGAQINQVIVVGGVPTAVVRNAGNSNTKGFEGDIRFKVTDHTLAHFEAQWINAKYNKLSYLAATLPRSGCTITPQSGQFSVNCNGKTPLFAPAWTISGGVQQTFPLANGASLVASADARYFSKQNTDFSFLPITRAPSSMIVDASLTYKAKTEDWSLGAWVSNLTDEVVPSAVQIGLPSTPFGTTLAPPRTYGLRLQFQF